MELEKLHDGGQDCRLTQLQRLVVLVYLPNASSSMSSAFGEREEHEIVVSRSSDGRVVRPVVGQVVDDRAAAVHDSMLDSSVRIVGRRYKLYVSLFFFFCCCIGV